MKRFNREELHLVGQASIEAQYLVGRYYALAPREWERVRFEVKTQQELLSVEVLESVLAHVVCYEYTRTIGREIVQQNDLYRICLQDSRILNIHSCDKDLNLYNLLTYVLTHEFVHVVRFSQRLQRLDLPVSERAKEEQSVERITERILSVSKSENLIRKLQELPTCLARAEETRSTSA